MKLLIVVRNFYPSTLGGPSLTLYWLAKALLNQGIDVTVITSSDHVPVNKVAFDKWIELDGIHVYFASVEESDSFHCPVTKMMKRYIKDMDVILLGSLFYKPSFFTSVWAKLYHKKVIWSPRGELFPAAINNKRFKTFYVKVLNKLFGKRTLFHATSEIESTYIKQYFGEAKYYILPNYMTLPERATRNPHCPYLLFVGRIAPIKALDKLLEALAISKKFRESGYTFCIAGGVEAQFEIYYQSLLILISKLQLKWKVEFLGSITGKKKEQLYADAYMSFLVSKSENFGNVVIEALAQGTPVIASKGTPWSSLNECEAGFWVSNDSQSLAMCIDEILMMQPETYQRMRQNALKLAENFDVERNISKWIHVLES